MLTVTETGFYTFFTFCNGDDPVFSSDGSHGGSGEWDNYVSCSLYPLRAFVNALLEVRNYGTYVPPIIFESLLGLVNFEPVFGGFSYCSRFIDNFDYINSAFGNHQDIAHFSLHGISSSSSFVPIGSDYHQHGSSASVFSNLDVSLIAPNNPTKNFNDPETLSKFLKDYHAIL